VPAQAPPAHLASYIFLPPPGSPNGRLEFVPLEEREQKTLATLIVGCREPGFNFYQTRRDVTKVLGFEYAASDVKTALEQHLCILKDKLADGRKSKCPYCRRLKHSA
jgi:hypothetical protein